MIKERKKIYIFDIDGTIFPSYNKKGESIFPDQFEDDPEVIQRIRERMKGEGLFPSFVEFYREIYKTQKIKKIYFLTGRRETDFWDETWNQLDDIYTNEKNGKKELVFFYPNDIEINVNYTNQRIEDILMIIQEDKGKSDIYIVDDRLQEYRQFLTTFFDVFEIENVFFWQIYEPDLFWRDSLKLLKEENEMKYGKEEERKRR